MTIIDLFQGDANYRIDFTLNDANGNPIDLTNGTPIAFHAQRENGTALAVNGTITVGTATAGMCYYTVQAADFADAGRYYAEIQVTFGTPAGKIITLGDIVINVKPQLPRAI